jgi:hypothetical protein
MTGTNEISIYKGDLTKAALIEQTKRVLKMFPKFPEPMLEELKDAFAHNGFTDGRMRDSINHVRDTYEGWDKLPNIANFIQFDRKIKFYDYSELLEQSKDFQPSERSRFLNRFILADVGFSEGKYIEKIYQEKFSIKKWGE